MKHLKRFDEELKPETYRRAGQRLQARFKEERGAKLIDYGNKQEFGTYNIIFAKDSGTNCSVILADAKVTEPNAEFTFQPQWKNRWDNSGKLIDEIKSAEELVKAWKQGECELAFNISFRFKATEESKLRSKNTDLRNWRGAPVFSFNVTLHDFADGLDEWNLEAEPGFEHDLFEMFETDFHAKITLAMPKTPMGVYGIFADRQSALLFKRSLPNLVEKFDDQIQEIVSVIGGESEHIEKIKSLFQKVSLNGLYEDSYGTEHTRNISLSSRWFNGAIIASAY
jgi:hypothetical protein